MSDIAPIGRPLAASFEAAPAHARTNGQTPAVGRASDSVELSSHAQLLGKLRSNPIRQGLVDAARAEIADGTYETEDKLDAAIESIIEDLG